MGEKYPVGANNEVKEEVVFGEKVDEKASTTTKFRNAVNVKDFLGAVKDQSNRIKYIDKVLNEDKSQNIYTAEMYIKQQNSEIAKLKSDLEKFKNEYSSSEEALGKFNNTGELISELEKNLQDENIKCSTVKNSLGDKKRKDQWNEFRSIIQGQARSSFLYIKDKQNKIKEELIGCKGILEDMKKKGVRELQKYELQIEEIKKFLNVGSDLGLVNEALRNAMLIDDSPEKSVGENSIDDIIKRISVFEDSSKTFRDMFDKTAVLTAVLKVELENKQAELQSQQSAAVTTDESKNDPEIKKLKEAINSYKHKITGFTFDEHKDIGNSINSLKKKYPFGTATRITINKLEEQYDAFLLIQAEQEEKNTHTITTNESKDDPEIKELESKIIACRDEYAAANILNDRQYIEKEYDHTFVGNLLGSLGKLREKYEQDSDKQSKLVGLEASLYNIIEGYEKIDEEKNKDIELKVFLDRKEKLAGSVANPRSLHDINNVSVTIRHLEERLGKLKTKYKDKGNEAVLKHTEVWGKQLADLVQINQGQYKKYFQQDNQLPKESPIEQEEKKAAILETQKMYKDAERELTLCQKEIKSLQGGTTESEEQKQYNKLKTDFDKIYLNEDNIAGLNEACDKSEIIIGKAKELREKIKQSKDEIQPQEVDEWSTQDEVPPPPAYPPQVEKILQGIKSGTKFLRESITKFRDGLKNLGSKLVSFFSGDNLKKKEVKSSNGENESLSEDTQRSVPLTDKLGSELDELENRINGYKKRVEEFTKSDSDTVEEASKELDRYSATTPILDSLFSLKNKYKLEGTTDEKTKLDDLEKQLIDLMKLVKLKQENYIEYKASIGKLITPPPAPSHPMVEQHEVKSTQQSEVTIKKNDARGGLLAQIEEGIKLRHVESLGEKPKTVPQPIWTNQAMLEKARKQELEQPDVQQEEGSDEWENKPSSGPRT